MVPDAYGHTRANSFMTWGHSHRLERGALVEEQISHKREGVQTGPKHGNTHWATKPTGKTEGKAKARADRI